MCGDKSKTVIKTVNGEIYDYPEFMALSSQVRQERIGTFADLLTAGNLSDCASAYLVHWLQSVGNLITFMRWRRGRNGNRHAF